MTIPLPRCSKCFQALVEGKKYDPYEFEITSSGNLDCAPPPVNFNLNPTIKDTNPKDKAATSRLDLSLFPSSARAYGALALTEGDLKYGGYNWRTAGVRVSVYVAACQRHLDKYYNGEDEDPVTNVPHLANALACLAVIIDSHEQGNLNDDRPPKQPMQKLFEAFESKVKALQNLFPNGPSRHTVKNESHDAH